MSHIDAFSRMPLVTAKGWAAHDTAFCRSSSSMVSSRVIIIGLIVFSMPYASTWLLLLSSLSSIVIFFAGQIPMFLYFSWLFWYQIISTYSRQERLLWLVIKRTSILFFRAALRTGRCSQRACTSSRSGSSKRYNMAAKFCFENLGRIHSSLVSNDFRVIWIYIYERQAAKIACIHVYMSQLFQCLLKYWMIASDIEHILFLPDHSKSIEQCLSYDMPKVIFVDLFLFVLIAICSLVVLI